MADNQHYVIDDGQNKIPGYTKTEVDELIESGAKAWSGTQAEYNALKQAGLLQPRSLYIITDAANLNGTAADLSFDGSTTTTKQKIDAKQDLISNQQATIDSTKWSSKTANREIKAAKYGNVVSLYMVFSLSEALNANEAIISGGGIPPSYYGNEIQVPITCVSGSNAGKTGRVRITNTGAITDWYSQSGLFAANNTFLLNACYITTA